MARQSKKRTGASLLEITVATAITALIITAAVGSIHQSTRVWSDYGGDTVKLESAHATALHLVRQLRQCTSVAAISLPADTAGSLSATDPDGNTLMWALDSTNVKFGVGAAKDVLSTQIDSLQFTGYEADGTQTTVAADIRTVEFAVTVTLDRNVGATKVIRSRVWMRAW